MKAKGRPRGAPHDRVFFSEDRSIEVVNARMGDEVSPRLKTVMTAVVRHLHDLVKEIELTQEEWEFAIKFLTQTGQMCSEERQEFILLSDVLGVSMLIDAINNRRPRWSDRETPSWGRFTLQMRRPAKWVTLYRVTEKARLAALKAGSWNLSGAPIAGAVIDVWSDNADGFYDVQATRHTSQNGTTAEDSKRMRTAPIASLE